LVSTDHAQMKHEEGEIGSWWLATQYGLPGAAGYIIGCAMAGAAIIVGCLVMVRGCGVVGVTIICCAMIGTKGWGGGSAGAGGAGGLVFIGLTARFFGGVFWFPTIIKTTAARAASKPPTIMMIPHGYMKPPDGSGVGAITAGSAGTAATNNVVVVVVVAAGL